MSHEQTSHLKLVLRRNHITDSGLSLQGIELKRSPYPVCWINGALLYGEQDGRARCSRDFERDGDVAGGSGVRDLHVDLVQAGKAGSQACEQRGRALSSEQHGYR